MRESTLKKIYDVLILLDANSELKKELKFCLREIKKSKTSKAVFIVLKDLNTPVKLL